MASAPEFDVAIVGGGISGIYTAWRLLKGQHDKLLTGALDDWRKTRGELKVGVFEGSNRIGGRLLSARSTHMPDTTCELGGMRYVSTHKRVANLVEQLGLKSEPQIVKPRHGSNICFIRNTRLRTNQLVFPSILPYHFHKNERPGQGEKPWSIVEKALDRALPGLAYGDRAQLYKWLTQQSVDGLELHNWGFWNLLLREMSGEGYEAAIDMIGYDVLGANYNAVDMIAEIYDFTDETEYRKLTDGYEKLPWTLKDEFIGYQGNVNFGWWLDGFDYNDKIFTLQFCNGNKVTAKALLLAMPRRSLERLPLERLLCDNPALQDNEGYLNAVSPISLFKLFLIYETPWWEDDCIIEGRSLTDLPVRQCYYWAISENSSEHADRGPAAIMMYNDVVNTDYWRGLIPEPIPSQASLAPAYTHLHPAELRRRKIDIGDPPEPFGPPTRPPQKLSEDPYIAQLFQNWDDKKAQAGRMSKEMHRLLLRMHGAKTESRMLDAAAADWPDAVHFWNVGYPSWKLMDKVVQPNPELHCYICGEAYSTYQTWVEGALQTSEIVLERLGLK